MIIGLTGGIGSGKTAVSDILASLNVCVIDADEVSKRVTAEGTECNCAMKTAFSDCVKNGALDRRLLKQKVFNSSSDLQLLNSLTHNYIFEEIKLLVKDKRTAVIVVPLLFESGFNKLCGYTVCITAPKEQRIERIIKRDKITKELAEKIIAVQLSDEELIQKCDYVIHNDGNFDLLKKRVEYWWNNLSF